MRAYALGLYEKAMPESASWKEKLEAAGAAGYDYVEMSIDATEEKIARVDWSKAERLDLIRTMYESETPIRSVCVSALTKYALGDPDEAICARGCEIIDKTIGLAEDLGIRLIMIPGYDIYYGSSTLDTKRRFLKNVRRVAERAARAGVHVGFETMENEFMNTVEKGMKYVALVGNDYLQLYPDIGNMTNAAVQYRDDVCADLTLGRGHLLALHLKETRPGVFREVPYGEGHVDFDSAVRTAWGLGIRRYVTEFWHKGEPDWREALARTRARFGALLDAVAAETR